MKLYRIAITGPESTGKSWLAENLAASYQTIWVREYAREYLAGINRHYEEEDILKIARGQRQLEQESETMAHGFLFSDTEMLVTKIWSEVKYGSCHPWILNEFAHQDYDLYLLCDIDLPWEYDPLREHPDQRQFLFDYYHKELTIHNFPFCIINGSGLQRLDNAIKCINHKIDGK